MRYKLEKINQNVRKYTRIQSDTQQTETELYSNIMMNKIINKLYQTSGIAFGSISKKKKKKDSRRKVLRYVCKRSIYIYICIFYTFKYLYIYIYTNLFKSNFSEQIFYTMLSALV